MAYKTKHRINVSVDGKGWSIAQKLIRASPACAANDGIFDVETNDTPGPQSWLATFEAEQGSNASMSASSPGGTAPAGGGWE